ncbi:hypothetical protein [Agrobacterium rubi]|uniref:hypothetical protein n=1 Tax=Agrobacterium rubi TaxID=28099 RepID=UPI001571FB0E|nr:hypothetical protein [Agrobacterium rubi]NTE87253.1 hypothetical protein [Agrobacterium rubi]NTF03187.1 hypothetical protein [Agrobacterium rubi]
MNRLIRRTIHLWQSWRAKQKLARAYRWQSDIDAAIKQAKRTPGKTGRVRDLEKRKRDEMTRALGGNV